MSAHPESVLAARFAALAPEPLEGDWLDVQRRTRRGGRRRVLVLAAAAVLGLLAVGSALGLAPRVIDFFSAAPAPARVEVRFDLVRKDLARLWGEGLPVVPGEARTVVDATFADGGQAQVFVAPRRGDGFCYQQETPGGNGTQCVSRSEARRLPLEPNATGGFLDSDPTQDRGWRHFAGYVTPPGTARLEVRYEGGAAEDVPFVWVSEPIDAGFFAFDPGDERELPGRRATELVALDEGGRTVARYGFSYAAPDDPWNWTTYVQRWPRAIDASTERVLVFPGSQPRKVRIAWTSDRRSFCYETVFGGLGAGGGCQRPGPAFPSYLGIASSDGGASLFGAVRPEVASVLLRFEDGARLVLRPREQLVFYEIPRDRYARGRRVIRATFLDVRGEMLGRTIYDPRHDAYYGAELEAPRPEDDPRYTPRG